MPDLLWIIINIEYKEGKNRPLGQNNYLCKKFSMKHIQYTPQGTCSILIDVTADDDDVIENVAFIGGCNGNLQGICRLVKGQKIDDVISKLDGIRCGNKITSCPDQLCYALKELKRSSSK